MKQGIVVGCDQTQEWLLPWWLANFRKHNDLPIAFIDFGLSDAAKLWCQERGVLVAQKNLLNSC